MAEVLLIRNDTSGKWHIHAGEGPDLFDPANNTRPVGDRGLCGRVDPTMRFPHITEPETVIPSYICSDCQKRHAALE